MAVHLRTIRWCSDTIKGRKVLHDAVFRHAHTSVQFAHHRTTYQANIASTDSKYATFWNEHNLEQNS